jgi:hypothetical protein
MARQAGTEPSPSPELRLRDFGMPSLPYRGTEGEVSCGHITSFRCAANFDRSRGIADLGHRPGTHERSGCKR